MVQKTIRFYDDSPDDQKALELIGKYKDLGFYSCREMIITAINKFQCDESVHITEQDIEKIADLVARKIDVQPVKDNDSSIQSSSCVVSNANNFDIAMKFINNL